MAERFEKFTDENGRTLVSAQPLGCAASYLFNIEEVREMNRLADEIEAEKETPVVNTRVWREDNCIRVSDETESLSQSFSVKEWWKLSEAGNDIAKEIDAEQAEIEMEQEKKVSIKKFNPDTKQITLEVILPIEAFDYVKSQAVLQKRDLSRMLFVMIKHYEETPVNRESLAAMAKLERLRKTEDGFLRISIYRKTGKASGYWQHIPLQGSETLPAVINAIEEDA